MCEFNSWVDIIQVGDKFSQVIIPMSPDYENVINKP